VKKWKHLYTPESILIHGGEKVHQKIGGKNMRKIEVGWIEESEFRKVLSEASARMTGTGRTCHIKGQGNYYLKRRG